VNQQCAAPAIPAEIWSSDLAKHASFDASPWFVSAPAEAILALARNAWQGDTIGHDVAAESACASDGVADVLQYVMFVRHGGLRAGYRCSIDGAAARAWLADFRPTVAAVLEPVIVMRARR
jgi:hypothetical protein